MNIVFSAIDENKQLLLVTDKLRMDLKAAKGQTISLNMESEVNQIIDISKPNSFMSCWSIIVMQEETPNVQHDRKIVPRKYGL